MYIVVSKWGVVEGHEAEVDQRGRKVRDLLRSTSGVEFVHGFVNQDGVFVAIIGYADEASYKRVVGDSKGPYAKAVGESGLLEHAVWVGSDRGESQD